MHVSTAPDLGKFHVPSADQLKRMNISKPFGWMKHVYVSAMFDMGVGSLII